MAYLRRNKKQVTNHALVQVCVNYDLEACAQFWLVYALVAAQGQVKSSYLTSGGSKSRKVSQLRHMAQYLCNITFGLKTVFIAGQLNRHRTTVGDAFSKIEDMRDDPKFDKFLTFSELALMAMSQSMNGEML